MEFKVWGLELVKMYTRKYKAQAAGMQISSVHTGQQIQRKRYQDVLEGAGQKEIFM